MNKTTYSLLGLIVIVLAGAGFMYFGSPSQEAPTSGTELSAKKSEVSAEISKYGEKVLRRGNGTEVATLDPNLATGQPEHRVLGDIFEGLIALDAKANLMPGVAESWEISEDGTIYTFNIRKNANWSNGEPVTAQDFVYAWQRLINPATGAQYSFMLYQVKNAQEINTGKITDLNQLGIKAIDDKTLEVELKSSTPYFLQLLTHYSTYPVPKAAIEAHGNEWTRVENIVSNGPFKMVEWVPQARLVVQKSATYYDKESVKLDAVIFYPTEDQSSALKRYRADELDFQDSVPLEQLDWARKNLVGELNEVPTLSINYFGLNATVAPFKDNIKLRKALNLAIDRDVLVESIFKSGVPAYSIVPPNVNNYKHYVPEHAQLTQEQRVAKAKELYAEAGYSAENPLEIEILYNTADINKKTSVAIAGMWQQNLGVKSTLTNKEWKVYLQDRRNKNTQVFRAGWIGDYNDPNTFLDMWLPESDLNDVGFISEEFVELLKAASAEQNLDERAKILHDAEKVFTDSYSVVPLNYKTDIFLIKKRVKGWYPNIMDTYMSRYAYFE